VDLTGTGAVRSDYWHHGLTSEVVSRNHSQFPGIPFFPRDGVGAGVAMTECEYAVGIADPSQSVFQCLPPYFQHLKSGTFIISVKEYSLFGVVNVLLILAAFQWPGYQHLDWNHEMSFVHPNGSPVSVSEMACQVAYMWRRFYRVRFFIFYLPFFRGLFRLLSEFALTLYRHTLMTFKGLEFALARSTSLIIIFVCIRFTPITDVPGRPKYPTSCLN
jgi:hypothetical protein